MLPSGRYGRAVLHYDQNAHSDAAHNRQDLTRRQHCRSQTRRRLGPVVPSRVLLLLLAALLLDLQVVLAGDTLVRVVLVVQQAERVIRQNVPLVRARLRSSRGARTTLSEIDIPTLTAERGVGRQTVVRGPHKRHPTHTAAVALVLHAGTGVRAGVAPAFVVIVTTSRTRRAIVMTAMAVVTTGMSPVTGEGGRGIRALQ